MPGGLLNIIGAGQQDIILTGNPTKTFWNSTYAKYTNFGMQKFRLEYEGQKTISLNNPSQFTFKFKRYGDLVSDTYLGINLPHIWSPLHEYASTSSDTKSYIPYEFKWIKHLGTQLIKSIEVNAGGATLQKYSGDYLTTMIERDFDITKQTLINTMTANLPEFNDPANAFQRNGKYPNAVYNKSSGGSEPSIRGRTLYIPLNAWFNLNTKQAFPLVSLQYNELTITVTLRPVRELFTIRDVLSPLKNFPHMAPNFTNAEQAMYTFLQSPPEKVEDYNTTINSWNADVHLITTYVFLGEDERRLFATQSQEYLVRDIHETIFSGIAVNDILDLKSMGLVSSWMWFVRREDAYKRNEWTNYSNWEYEDVMPNPSTMPPTPDISWSDGEYVDTPAGGYRPPTVDMLYADLSGSAPVDIHPVFKEQGASQNNPFKNYWGGTDASFSFSTSGIMSENNQKHIMNNAAIMVDGKYRENIMDKGIYNYIEKYTRTSGSGKDGLYCYNYTLDTNSRNIQPTGAINFSKFNKIQLEVTTIQPPVSENNIFNTVCSTSTDRSGELIGVVETHKDMFKYRFEVVFMEERYNIIKFIGGNVNMIFSN